jgi:hypothetical protein
MTAEQPGPVFAGELTGPPGLAFALGAAVRESGPTRAQRSLLNDLGLVDGEHLAEDLEPIAHAITAPLLTLSVELHMRGTPVVAQGWLDREQGVLGVPESTGDGAPTRLICFATAELAHRLAGFLDLGPRPSREDAGALLVEHAALRDLLGSGAGAEKARHALRLEDAAADKAVVALCGHEALHWRLDLQDVATAGGTFSRSTEAVDAGNDGLWLIGPSADEALVLVVPASTTRLWRLLTTMLPTKEETAVVLAATEANSPRCAGR